MNLPRGRNVNKATDSSKKSGEDEERESIV
jgi:hypothetical protein